MKKVLLLLLTLTLAFTSALFVTSCKDDSSDDDDKKHMHSLTFVDAVEETCTTDGNISFYHCSGCDKNYSDENATTEIDNVVIKASHALSFVDAVEKTCTTDGNVAHYHCSRCLKNYSDINTTTEINNVVIKASHTLTYIEAVEKTYTSDGNIAHYHCTECLKNYSDKNASTEIADVVIKKNLVYFNDDGLAFILLDNDTFLVSRGNFDDNKLTIPSTFNGKLVSAIEKGTFSSCSSLEEITIPFVGESPNGKSSTHFGYIFGASDHNNNSSKVPTNLKKVTVTNGNIPSCSFFNCNNITTIILKDKITKIGANAFSGCSSLTSITIPDSVTSIGCSAFSRCSLLTSVTISDNVTSIGLSAFSGCSSLEEITIPFVGVVASKSSSNTYQNPFGYIFGTSSYAGGSETKQYYNSDYYYTYYIPSSLKKVTVTSGNILYGTFYGCKNITTIVLGDNVTSIDSRAFYGCDSLEYNTYDNAYYLGNDNNPYLWLIEAKDTSSCTIHANTKGIAGWAFDGSLYAIDIPKSVTLISDHAFGMCTYLKTIRITDINSWLKINGLENIMPYGQVGKYFYVNKELLTEVNFTTVTSIPAYSFYKCSNITKVTIGKQVTSIGGHAFGYCGAIENVYYTSDINSWVQISGLANLMSEGKSSKNLYINGTLLTKANITTATSIPSSAFYGCTSLTKVTIGDQVTSIGYRAFFWCNSLEYNTYGNAYYLGNDNNPYLWLIKAKNTSITSCTVNSNTKGIANYAFYTCKSLTSVTIGNSVTSIGNYAFYGCSSLTSVTIGNSVTSIGEWAFYYCSSLTSVTIPDSVTSIGSFAFYGCSSLTSITIPDKVTSIGDRAFDNCSSLTSITIPNNVTSIGYGTFDDCSSLTSVTIGNGVTSIGWDAFYRCSSLTSINIPDSVTSIGDRAFYNCSSLEYNTYDNAYYLGNDNNPYLLLVKAINTSITSCTINSNTKFIHSSAFEACTSLTSITIPDKVTSIGDRAFYNCSSLTSVTIPDKVTSIGTYAFYKCSSLASITIPDKVTSIGEKAFYYCSSLTSVTFENTSWWYVTQNSSATSGTNVDVTDDSQNVTYLTDTYDYYYWKRK